MRELSHIVAVKPPDAVELRVVRRFVRKTTGQAASEWLGDALAGSEGPSDASPPLRITEIHWLTATHATTPIVLGPDERVDPDDLAVLISEARRSGLRFAIWSEGGAPRNPTMTQVAAWFTGASVQPGASSPLVQVDRRHDEFTVIVDEHQPRQPWWLIMIPAMVLSFAWIFFLVLGALPRMVREIWQRGAVGLRQRTIAVVDTKELQVRVERNGKLLTAVTTERQGLAAIGEAAGLTAYTDGGAVDLQAAWATTDTTEQAAIKRAMARAVNSEINAL